MADLSQLQINGTTYDLKDAVARFPYVPVASVDATSTATAFTVQVPGITELKNGAYFYCYNGTVTSKANFTLNVNGLGAKPVYNSTGSRITTGFAKTKYFNCWYDADFISGGCWFAGYLSDTNTTSISNLLRNNGTYIADSAIHRYQLLFEVDENTLTPLTNANNVVATTKTMLTDVEFDPFKPIYYYYSTTTVAENAAIGAGALFWSYNGIDLRYTFNCGSTLTAHKPFYLVVTPTSGGKCKLANTTPWSQTLPNSNDGKWYILLGRTYSTYNFVLYDEHPVFYHDGTGVKQIISADTIGDAATVNGHSVNKDVPANAVFTDTTYDIATTSNAGLLSAADKIKLDSIITSNANSPIIVVETAAFSSLPVTITSNKITENHYLLESTLSNPAAQSDDWTITTSNGSMTISGTISGSTTAKIILGRVDTTSATILMFDIASFSSLPKTITDSRITAYHYVLHTELGTPSAQADDWSINTGTGSMSISGTISGSTTMRVILGTAGSL